MLKKKQSAGEKGAGLRNGARRSRRTPCGPTSKIPQDGIQENCRLLSGVNWEDGARFETSEE